MRIEAGFFPQFGINSSLQSLSPVNEEEKAVLPHEELAQNYRLACLARLTGDVLVYVPEESRGAEQVILASGAKRPVKLKPAVAGYHVTLENRVLGDLRGDWEYLKEALVNQKMLATEVKPDYHVLTKIAPIIRQENGRVTAWVWQDKEVIEVQPGFQEELYGVAVDVGTTTLAAYLCNLRTGEVAATASLMNPQVRYGEDVLARIAYADTGKESLAGLNQTIIEGINQTISRLTDKTGLLPLQVADLTLVFNTAMHHLALNLDPRFLGRAPFLPVVKESLDLKARDLGIHIAGGAWVHVLPVEAGFVGADNMAVIIAEEVYRSPVTKLIIDIGTNGEIVLGNRDFIASTSCATGPALEGAQIAFGMRAAEGAIERVRIDSRSLAVDFKVIGSNDWFSRSRQRNAKGICGSGIIDAVAELVRCHIILENGRFNKELATKRLRQNPNSKWEFVLAWAWETAIKQEIVITQKDIRAVQLAKAALYTGAKYLMQKFAVDEPDEIILAGAFGTYIDPVKALILGMIPDCSPERIKAVGNAAGDGARLALLSTEKRLEAEEIAKKVIFIETSLEKDFQKNFTQAITFPHAIDRFPHLEELLAPTDSAGGDNVLRGGNNKICL
ncbi:MAG TPA: ferredoxin [Pelotomaculum sp.]|nr:ferredoxin [Pelotomaculum sp.]